MIAGLGMTEIGRVYGRTAAQFAAEAVRLAAADAGLALGDLDGLLVSAGSTGGVQLSLQRDLGLRDLRLLTRMQAYGSTAAAMVQFASMAIGAGMADVVACVWADGPLRPGSPAAAAYSRTARVPAGWAGLAGASAILGPNPMYALAARRHMAKYGTSNEDLGSIAIAQRAWAALNPLAQLREPITMADYLAARCRPPRLSSGAPRWTPRSRPRSGHRKARTARRAFTLAWSRPGGGSARKRSRNRWPAKAWRAGPGSAGRD